MKKCECCETKKPDVRRRIDPFQCEVWDETVLRDLCDDCHYELRMDI